MEKKEFITCSQLAFPNQDGIAHINFPIDLVAICHSQIAPTIHLILHSYGDDGSRTVEGYGNCYLPMTNGSHTITISTWRIKGTIRDELRLTFFNGGLEQQKTIENKLVDTNGNENDVSPIYNRFGMRTTAGAIITLRFYVAMQSSRIPPRQQQQPTVLGTIGKLNSSFGKLSSFSPKRVQKPPGE